MSDKRNKPLGPPPGLPEPVPQRPIENIENIQSKFNESQQYFNKSLSSSIAGIFFDNDEKKIEQVEKYCKNIKLVKIPETDYTTIYKPDPNIKDQLLKINPLAFSTKENIYYKFHEQNTDITSHPFYDIKSGIQAEHIAELEQWFKRTIHNEKRYAFFDWDRTLSMCEGVVIIPTANTDQNIVKAYAQYGIIIPDNNEDRAYEDMSIYLAGGDKRLHMLRQMFTMLRENGITIIILTNNGACVTPTQAEYYKKLVRKFVGYNDIEFLCSAVVQDTAISDKKDIKYGKGNKGYALINDPRYKDVCKGKSGFKGGRRRCSTRGRRACRRPRNNRRTKTRRH